MWFDDLNHNEKDQEASKVKMILTDYFSFKDWHYLKIYLF